MDCWSCEVTPPSDQAELQLAWPGWCTSVVRTLGHRISSRMPTRGVLPERESTLTLTMTPQVLICSDPSGEGPRFRKVSAGASVFLLWHVCVYVCVCVWLTDILHARHRANEDSCQRMRSRDTKAAFFLCKRVTASHTQRR